MKKKKQKKKHKILLTKIHTLDRVLAMKCRAQKAYLQVNEKTETSSFLRGD